MKNENGITLPRICFSMALETIFPYFVFRKMRQVYNTSRDFTVSGSSSKVSLSSMFERLFFLLRKD